MSANQLFHWSLRQKLDKLLGLGQHADLLECFLPFLAYLFFSGILYIDHHVTEVEVYLALFLYVRTAMLIKYLGGGPSQLKMHCYI